MIIPITIGLMLLAFAASKSKGAGDDGVPTVDRPPPGAVEVPTVPKPPPGAVEVPTVDELPPDAEEIDPEPDPDVPVVPPGPPAEVITSPGLPPILTVDELPRDAREIPGLIVPTPDVGDVVDIDVPELAEPPPDAVEVSPPEDIPTVDEPPPDAVEVIDSPLAPPGAIPDASSQAGKVALMLYESAPSGPVKDVALLDAWKRAVGVQGRPDLYGPGTARSLIGRGIVPPTPWDWPAPESKSKSDYRNQLQFMARQDPARSEEWRQAAEDV